MYLSQRVGDARARLAAHCEQYMGVMADAMHIVQQGEAEA